MVQEDVRRPYVDYKYYKDDYRGKQIASETDFKRIEKLAEAFVDRVTFGRIARLQTIPASLYLVCASENVILFFGLHSFKPFCASVSVIRPTFRCIVILRCRIWSDVIHFSAPNLGSELS